MLDNPPIPTPEYPQDLVKPKSWATHAGFTLIEILIVLVIIGITAGFAMMAFGDFGKERKIIASAEALVQMIDLIHEKALFESSTLQLDITPAGYSVQRLSYDHHWQALTSSLYHHHSFPAATQLSREVGSHQQEHLIILFDASGDMTPFVLYMGSAEHPKLVFIEGKSDGQIRLQRGAHP